MQRKIWMIFARRVKENCYDSFAGISNLLALTGFFKNNCGLIVLDFKHDAVNYPSNKLIMRFLAHQMVAPYDFLFWRP